MRFFVLLMVFLLCCFGSCTQATTGAKNLDPFRNLSLLSEAFSTILERHVKDVDPKKITEAAITGMVTVLDPHSAYLNEHDLKELDQLFRGTFGGVGVEVILEGGLLKVITPIDDTPASRAGIKPGDFILELEDISVLGLSLKEAVSKLRGAPGTTVRFKVFRPGQEPFEMTLTRELIKTFPVKYQLIDHVAHVRITTFLHDALGVELRKILAEIQHKEGENLRGIVLDVRNNAGGLVDQALEVINPFLEKAPIVLIQEKDPLEPRVIYSEERAQFPNLPVVVLINEGSASASEIVAGAFQHHRRGLVMGTRSFGKGSVQTLIPLLEGGAIKLTTALYATPSGKSIQGEGITPDIEVFPAQIQPEKIPDSLREENLSSALKVARQTQQHKKDVSKSSVSNLTLPSPEEDFQLRRALDVVIALSILSHPNFNLRSSPPPEKSVN